MTRFTHNINAVSYADYDMRPAPDLSEFGVDPSLIVDDYSCDDTATDGDYALPRPALRPVAQGEADNGTVTE